MELISPHSSTIIAIIFSVFAIIYCVLLFFIIFSKYISLTEKILLLIAITALPIIGWLLAAFHLYSKRKCDATGPAAEPA